MMHCLQWVWDGCRDPTSAGRLQLCAPRHPSPWCAWWLRVDRAPSMPFLPVLLSTHMATAAICLQKKDPCNNCSQCVGGIVDDRSHCMNLSDFYPIYLLPFQVSKTSHMKQHSYTIHVSTPMLSLSGQMVTAQLIHGGPQFTSLSGWRCWTCLLNWLTLLHQGVKMVLAITHYIDGEESAFLS